MIEPLTIKRKVEPYHVCALDIETGPLGNVLGVGFAYSTPDGRDYQAFDSWAGWMAFYCTLLLDTPKTKRGKLLRIYAHNGSNFDWLSLLHWLESQDVLAGLKIITSESTAIGLDFKIILDEQTELNIKLRDSLKLVPVSLKVAAKTFNTEHQKMDLDDTLPADLLSVSPDLFWQYLRNDTLALQEVVFTFWSNIVQVAGNIGELPMTQASLALRLWKMQNETVIMTPWSKRLKAFERRAYRGGRVESFKTGTFDVNIYDANSEYPTVMQSGTFPTSDRGYWTDRYEGEHGLYDINFQQDNVRIPPILADEGTGEFQYIGRGVFTTPELVFALERGIRFIVIEGYIFKETGDIFRSFIDRWWGIRRDAQAVDDEGMSYSAKILMNSLYGKFGQRETSWVVKQMTGEEEIRHIKAGHDIKYVGPYIMIEEETHSEHTFVGIAAYVTGYARLHLYRKIESAIQNGGQVIYCDTDSVHCVDVVLDTGDDLGEWKHEYEGEVTYLGRKLYAFKGGKIKAKGIGKLGRSALGYDDFLRMARDPHEFTIVGFDTFPTWRETVGDMHVPAKLIRRQRTIRQTKIKSA